MMGQAEEQGAIQQGATMWLRKRGDAKSFRDEVIKTKCHDRSFSDHVIRKGVDDKIHFHTFPSNMLITTFSSALFSPTIWSFKLFASPVFLLHLQSRVHNS